LKKKALALDQITREITSWQTGWQAGMVPMKWVDLQP